MSDHADHGKQGQGSAPIPQHAQVHQEEGEGSWLVSYADMMTLLVGFFVILLSFSSVDQEKLEQVKQAAAKEFGGTYQIPYGDLADRIKKEIEKFGLGNQFQIKQTDLGVDISFLGTVFFESGAAEIKPEGNQLLNKLIPVIQAETKNFSVVIEGHTDNVPVVGTSGFKSNWELSSMRACRVLESFEARGFEKTKLTAVGYGESRPIVPNLDSNGVPIPNNQSQNRRVLIKIIRPTETLVPQDADAPAPQQEGEG